MLGHIDPTIVKAAIEHVLFIIEMSCYDDEFIAYVALRANNILVEPFVNVVWVDRATLKIKGPVQGVARDLLFGVTVNKQSKASYTMRITAFPTQPVDIRLKRTKVLPKSDLLIGKSLLQVRVQKIFVDMDKMSPPRRVVVYGTHQGDVVEHELPLPAGMVTKFASYMTGGLIGGLLG